ncbi:MAG: hypothetical protein Kow0099_30220 [Candidatus Abyssubacteria bacterium]
MRRKIRGCALSLAVLCVLALSCSGKKILPEAEHYKLIHRIFLQPVDHAHPDGPTLEQHVDILLPDGAPTDAPVFFHLGNEGDIGEEDLVALYRLHGARRDIIYVQAEHRGYGQSLTKDEDQSVPSYVRLEQALADAHCIIRELKKEYPGPWMAAGWSYGGGLVINFAARYPDDVEVILSSSGVVDWPFMNYSYERRVKALMGDACHARLVEHMKNLEPQEMFDTNWREREFLLSVIVGLTQYEEYEKLVPLFKLMSRLSTGTFLSVLHAMDERYGSDGRMYSVALSTRKLSRDEAITGRYNWRVWRYQQCAEVGVFFASENGEGRLVRQSRDDFCEECKALFGEAPAYADGPEWSPRAMLELLEVPLIYVAGGEDPWFAVGLERGYRIKSGKYFYVSQARHCPDREDPELAQEVLVEMLKHALAGESS